MLRTLLFTTLCAAVAACWMIVGTLRPSKAQNQASSFDRCDAMTDEKSRLNCFQALIGIGGKSKATTDLPSSWRLLKIKEPEGKREITSIIRTADTLQSDTEIAGLMIRCSETAEIEVLVALLSPLPLRAHPTVTVLTGSDKISWPASIVAPGELVLLPAQAADLANGEWQQARELDIAVQNAEFGAHGIIPLDGLSAGLSNLRSNCPRR